MKCLFLTNVMVLLLHKSQVQTISSEENISKVVRSTWWMLAWWRVLGDKPYATAFKIFCKTSLGFITCLFLKRESRPTGPRPPWVSATIVTLCLPRALTCLNYGSSPYPFHRAQH